MLLLLHTVRLRERALMDVDLFLIRGKDLISSRPIYWLSLK